MLVTFHYGSKQLICEPEHYVTIIFFVCFICVLIYALVYSEDEIRIEFEAIGSIIFLSIFTIGNVWSLEPCVTTMYPLKTLILAIGLTICLTIILTEVAFKFKYRWDLTVKEKVLGLSLFVLIVCFIVTSLADGDVFVCFCLQSLCFLMFCLYLISKYF